MQKIFTQIPVIAGVFCCYSIFSLNEFYGGSVWVTESLSFSTDFLLASILALRAVGDAARRGRAVPYDFGTFVFFAWFVVLPVYLAKTRGWRAIFPILGFVAIFVASAVFAYFIVPG